MRLWISSWVLWDSFVGDFIAGYDAHRGIGRDQGC